MTTVAEASAAAQTAADRKNALDAKLRDLRSQEHALGEQISRVTAAAFPNDPDPAALSPLEAQRDDTRTQIERYESAERILDTDFDVAAEVLQDAQRAERQAAHAAVINRARAVAGTYSDAVQAFISARAAMRAIASSLPGQEAAVVQLMEDVVSFALYQTPANAAYGQPFAVLVESYLSKAGVAA
jgi:chaperonin cofactor prefoldin